MRDIHLCLYEYMYEKMHHWWWWLVGWYNRSVSHEEQNVDQKSQVVVVGRLLMLLFLPSRSLFDTHTHTDRQTHRQTDRPAYACRAAPMASRRSSWNSTFICIKRRAFMARKIDFNTDELFCFFKVENVNTFSVLKSF